MTIQMGIVKSTVMISIGLSEYLILPMVKLQIMHYYLISFSTNWICPHFKFPVYSKVFLKAIFIKLFLNSILHYTVRKYIFISF